MLQYVNLNRKKYYFPQMLRCEPLVEIAYDSCQ